MALEEDPICPQNRTRTRSECGKSRGPSKLGPPLGRKSSVHPTNYSINLPPMINKTPDRASRSIVSGTRTASWLPTKMPGNDPSRRRPRMGRLMEDNSR